MGCDIHLYIEYKSKKTEFDGYNPGWQSFGNRINRDRLSCRRTDQWLVSGVDKVAIQTQHTARTSSTSCASGAQSAGSTLDTSCALRPLRTDDPKFYRFNNRDSPKFYGSNVRNDLYVKIWHQSASSGAVRPGSIVTRPSSQ